MDTEYLKLTVGDALTRGCAATATVRPADSVEYLAKWLHKCVTPELLAAFIVCVIWFFLFSPKKANHPKLGRVCSRRYVKNESIKETYFAEKAAAEASEAAVKVRMGKQSVIHTPTSCIHTSAVHCIERVSPAIRLHFVCWCLWRCNPPFISLSFC